MKVIQKLCVVVGVFSLAGNMVAMKHVDSQNDQGGIGLCCLVARQKFEHDLEHDKGACKKMVETILRVRSWLKTFEPNHEHKALPKGEPVMRNNNVSVHQGYSVMGEYCVPVEQGEDVGSNP